MAGVVASTDSLPSVIDVDLKWSNMRYMRVNAPTAGNGTVGANFCAICILSQPDQGPLAAGDRGLKEWVEVPT
jgi:hypothetical protein